MARQLAVAAMAGVAALLIPLFAAGGAAALPSPCSVTISASPTSLQAAVTSSSAAAAVFYINYTVEKPASTRAVLTLEAFIDTGWTATVSPASITLASNIRTGTATATVVVPAGALTTQVGSVRVEANMVVAGYQCQGDSVDGLTVTPLPFFDSLSARIVPEEVPLSSGGGSFMLHFGAKANVPVTIAILLEGPGGLTFDTPTTFPLPLSDNATLGGTTQVRMRGAEVQPGVYQLSITVRGLSQDGKSLEGVLFAPLVVEAVPSNLAAGPFIPLAILGAVGAAVALWWWRR